MQVASSPRAEFELTPGAGTVQGSRSRPLMTRVLLAWVAFVAYGSLLPFELRSVEWDAAWQTFRNLPWLSIGLGGRIDWLANVLLYVPVTYLGTHFIATRRIGLTRASPMRWTWAAIAAFAGAAALAVVIEFAQIFVAPRTVSLNDLAAELLGSAVGCLLAVSTARRLGGVVDRLLDPAGDASLPALQLYLLAYLALCFFPFDFSTAMAVLAQKIQSGHAGWLLAPVNANQPTRLILKLGAEVALAIPLGLWLARVQPRMRWPVAAVLGLVLGAGIELVQLVLLSATSQGASALTRACGVVLGVWVFSRADLWRPWLTAERLRAVAWGSVLPWLAMLAALAGWHRVDWAVDGWPQRLAQLHFLPFYYHYYVGEAQALTSVLLCAAGHAWAGVVVALASRQASPRGAMLLGGAVSLVFEGALLFATNRHPDPSNPWIAALAAGVAHQVVRRLMPALSGGASSAVSRSAGAAPAHRLPERPAFAGSSDHAALHEPTLWIAMLLIVIAPRIAPGSMGADLTSATAFFVCAWRRPNLAPALWLPTLLLTDVAAWTGHRWIDTLDLVLLATAAAAWLRPRLALPAPSTGISPWIIVWCMAGLLPGSIVGLQTLRPDDPNALLTPVGGGFGLLQAKGLLLALAMAVYLWRRCTSPATAIKALSAGACVALAGTVGLTIFERLSFVAPLDFASDYRAPGPFSAIALGGAFIECVMAALVPFAVFASLRSRLPALRWANAALVLLSAYATMVTFSRAGQVVFIAVAVLTALAATLQAPSRQAPRASAGAVVKGLLLAAAVLVVAGAVLKAPFAQARFDRLSEDVDIRLSHWREGLSFSRGDASALLFGNGAGSFGREAYIQGEPKSRPGMFTLESADGNTWVKVHAGALSYLDQRVSAAYDVPYTVSARVRSASKQGVQVLFCEKDFVQSRGCAVASLAAPPDGQWHVITRVITLKRNPVVTWPHRPLRLTVFSGGNGTTDIDDLSMTDPSGNQLLRNGGFDDAARHWMYSSDMHLTWHMKSLWLHVLFEFGWVGVLSHALLLGVAVRRAWRAARSGLPEAWALVFALAAFQGVGLIDSVIDSPRFALLYMALLIAAIMLTPRPGPAAVSTQSARGRGTG